MKNYVVTVNGTSYEVMVEEVSGSENMQVKAAAPIQQPVIKEVAAKKPEPVVVSKPATSGTVGSKSLQAPMPGTIVKVVATQGASIKKGDVILVLEAMKMENDIVAPEDCVVASINVTQGASVNSGDLLVTFN